ncbi:MAG: right-handed parallel beta-helix repeat-containing protein [Chloroflexi bacterium]|nr:right-handed parallel beta-helix repeat-containing protein [Chloroflexota bacterium]MDA1146013.1 right-handed parallel beta-helix repeat-containing protein [Chloroflexota bacterium]
MSIRRLLSVLPVVAVLTIALVLPRSEAVAAGTISGNLPPNGGLALVSWSGGPTDEIVTVAGQRGCALSSIWSFVGGFPIGYLVGAPDFVNGSYLAVYSGGQVPAGPLLLVCHPTLVLQPSDNVAARIAAQPAGTTFRFGPGVYRGLKITPRTGDVFEGEPGAIFSGARILEGLQQDGGAWSVGGQTSQLGTAGSCARFLGQGYSGCQHPEQLFMDGNLLWQVTNPGQLASGRWYFDYGADRIYVADNPAGRTIELSDTSAAFTEGGRDVTIRGLVIEKYANRAQDGAIHPGGGATGWLVEDNEVRYNHGTGIRTRSDMVVRDNFVHHQCQLGVGGVGDRVLIEGNEISFNGISGFDPFWEAGGTKWAVTNDLIVRNNHVHDNRGRGLWTDIDNRNTLYEGNLAENNDQSGIAHEISYSAVIRNNIVRNNGLAFDTWLWGAQILVQNSAQTSITGNTVTVAASGGDGIAVINQNRGAGRFGTYRSENVTVQGNDITYLGALGQSGIADDTPGGYSCQGGANNVFNGNTYRTANGTAKYWFWCNELTWSALQARGSEGQGILVGG